jgi:hypothetical protein
MRLGETGGQHVVVGTAASVHGDGGSYEGPQGARIGRRTEAVSVVCGKGQAKMRRREGARTLAESLKSGVVAVSRAD